jgi:hypothetical protein
MYGIISGIAKIENTTTEIRKKSFGLSERMFDFPTEYTCFLSIFALIFLSPDPCYKNIA